MSTSNPLPAADVARALAEHIAHLRYTDLSHEVVEAAKLSILDTVAATIAGAVQPGVAETITTLRHWGGKAESTIALWGDKLPAQEALIANVTMAHALELDDAHYPAIVHPTAPTLWSAMATAESIGGVSGADLILALAGGVDLMARLGLAAPRTLYLGYHTALFSGFGAAAAAARLRGLDATRIHDAFGITSSQAGATVQAATDGALVKRLQPAFNAGDGLRAVLHAECGITGISNVFEGPYGFFHLFNHSRCDRTILLDQLGRKFYGTELTVKRYPTSRCAHGPIEATLALVQSHRVKPDDVARVVVEVSQGCVNICGAPYEVDGQGSQTGAQFSIPYTVAAAIRWGEVFVSQLSTESITDPAVVALARRVQTVTGSALTASMSFTPVTVRIELRDGSVLTHTVEHLKGSPENRLRWDEVVAERLQRAATFAPHRIDQGRLREIEQMIRNFDRIDDATRLMTLLNPPGVLAASRPAPGKLSVAVRRTATAPDAIASLVEHIGNTRYDDIPQAALDATKRLFLDTITATIAGAGAPACAGIVSLLTDAGGLAESSVAVFGAKLPAHNAVIANVMMCHARQLDDLYDSASVHASAPVLWSGLAIGEALGGVSGRDFLAAATIGADVMFRIGASAPDTFALGHHHALLAGFAAVATAGKLKHGAPQVLLDAFGINFCQAAASVQALADDALVQRLQAALNASDGLRSLAFAEAGITGVRHVLEGKFGFAQLFGHAACDREQLLEQLGRRFLNAESGIKASPPDTPSWSDLVEERMNRCVSHAPRALPQRSVAALIEVLTRLEDVADIRDITRLLVPDPA